MTNNAGGHIFGNLAGIEGQTVNVTNFGLIEATQPNGIAINASGTATVSNSGDGITTGIIRRMARTALPFTG